MRRIELRPSIEVPNDKGGTSTIQHARYLADLVRGDGSYGVWPKTTLGLAIIQKLASAKGHVFLDDAEYVALKASLHGVPMLTCVAFPAAEAGWQAAIDSAEEWVERDGQLVRAAR